jgi:hypothetical protein
MPVVIRPVYPVRPIVGVTIVPTTPLPSYYTPVTPILPVRPMYTVYLRNDPLPVWSVYGRYSSLWRAEEVSWMLESFYGFETMVR